MVIVIFLSQKTNLIDMSSRQDSEKPFWPNKYCICYYTYYIRVIKQHALAIEWAELW